MDVLVLSYFIKMFKKRLYDEDQFCKTIEMNMNG